MLTQFVLMHANGQVYQMRGKINRYTNPVTKVGKTQRATKSLVR